MTDIGRMIYEDGLAEGIAKGKAEGKNEGKAEGITEGKAEGMTEGKADLLIKQLIKKFKRLPENYRKEIKSLPDDSLEIIAIDIFDLVKIEDLEKYFK